MRMEHKLRSLLWGLVGFLVLCCLGGSTLGAEPTCEELIEDEVWDFSLPSNHDRLVNYGCDYYGAHNLILTFFPAAFTPV